MRTRRLILSLSTALGLSASALPASTVPPHYRTALNFTGPILINDDVRATSQDITKVMTNTYNLPPNPVPGITDTAANWNHLQNVAPDDIVFIMAGDALPAADPVLSHMLPVNIEYSASPDLLDLPLGALQSAPDASDMLLQILMF